MCYLLSSPCSLSLRMHILRITAICSILQKTAAFTVTHPSKVLKRNTVPSRMSSSLSQTAKRVLVPIADDSEEIETSSITDTLVRFGAEVVVASVKSDGELICKMSRGLKVCADTTIEEASKEEWDCIALPGGMPGAKHLRDCPTLIEMLKKQNDQKKLFGAICASPAVVLQSHGLIGEGATCYPAKVFRETMQAPSDAKVCMTNNIVTSQGPGTSLLFALMIGEQMYGKEAADEVAAGLLVSRE